MPRRTWREIDGDPQRSLREDPVTTYAGGEQTHTEEMKLPFDPTKCFHDYAFSHDRNSVTFSIYGEPMKSYAGGLPDSTAAGPAPTVT